MSLEMFGEISPLKAIEIPRRDVVAVGEKLEISQSGLDNPGVARRVILLSALVSVQKIHDPRTDATIRTEVGQGLGVLQNEYPHQQEALLFNQMSKYGEDHALTVLGSSLRSVDLHLSRGRDVLNSGRVYKYIIPQLAASHFYLLSRTPKTWDDIKEEMSSMFLKRDERIRNFVVKNSTASNF